MKQFNGDLQGKTVALWGLAFKPETDDMREAPALVLIDKLLKAGCKVRAYDPAAVQECKRRIGDTIYYACDMYDAVLDADVLMLVTEWKNSVCLHGPLSRKRCPGRLCWTDVIYMIKRDGRTRIYLSLYW